ncbi:hypothetical protein K488DRAFT_48291 [Vararia minispora EC-137]|uniref:Uncharacterized protein n=1 Tax=Vararia minispora EC-137 TaxID=1314806 RepID=A0ACB8QNW6_9AGAM|nr:hypothetical protein K488DRAFT_48291 [Vararia minispora EC-137]
MQENSPILRVQITQIDHYLAQSGRLDCTSLPKAPVIRVYGQSSLGFSCCLHIHQVYPYFYVEYPGRMDPESVHQYISRLTHSLNHTLAISLKRNPYSSNSIFVRAIVLVKGIHFYGFHSSYSPFLKVHLEDPNIIQRATTIMRSGTIMATRFHIFESHLGFILQFLCDFGLYGCGWIDLSEVWERVPNDSSYERKNEFFPLSPYFRQSKMHLEVDVLAAHILNRSLLTARDVHHELKIPAVPFSSGPFVPSVRELWDDERRRRAAAGLSPSPTIPSDPSESSRGSGGDWVAKDRFWEDFLARIQEERGHDIKPGAPTWVRWVMTTFESVQVLWPDEFKTWKPLHDQSVGVLPDTNPYAEVTGGSQKATAQAVESDEVWRDIDMTALSGQEMAKLIQEEETPWDGQISSHFPLQDEDENEHEDISFYEDYLEVEAITSKLMQTPLRDENDDPETPHKTSTASLRRPTSATPRKQASAFQAAFRKLAGGESAYHLSCLSPMSEAYTGLLRELVADNTTPTTAATLTPRRSLSLDRGTIGDMGQFRQSEKTYECFRRSERSSYKDGPSLPPLPAPDFSRVKRTSEALADAGSPRPRKRVRLGEEMQSPFHVQLLAFGAIPPTGRQNVALPVFQTQSPRVFSKLAKKASRNVYQYRPGPPPVRSLLASLGDFGLPSKVYRNPYYSRAEDAGDVPWEFSGLTYHLKGGDGLDVLEEWGSSPLATLPETRNLFLDWFDHVATGGWEYIYSPPGAQEVRRWLKSDAGRAEQIKNPSRSQQIDGPTQHAFGLKETPEDRLNQPTRDRQAMSILSLEIFVRTRGSLVPNPEVDELAAVFWSFDSPVRSESDRYSSGTIAVEDLWVVRRLRDSAITFVANELDLLNTVVDTIVALDPDVIVGWEIQSGSWGYVAARAKGYGYDLSELISRAPGRVIGSGDDNWGLRQTSTFRVVGRHVLNVWRIIRSELNLGVYTFENTTFHLLHKRVPRYSYATLTEWATDGRPSDAARMLSYFRGRTTMVLEMLDIAEIMTKTAEFARVFGVDFFSVISRGSQFKVESFMFRIAKPESLVLLSPSKRDVGNQNAAECMPLIMEPLSAFYNSPLVVLDFQSLYPSVMIAYNYCYSTCIGRITPFKGIYKLGVTEVKQPQGLLEALRDHINIAPNGIMYVNKEVRQGLLGRMLAELLDTRVMVKQAMKRAKDNKTLLRILNARQLGLKYIANVTYGYTGATFSGRMPSVEIADSIVQTGRETLEKAIDLIETTPKWGASVVYGDTDSLFIYLPGKTKDQAFRIGHDIADKVTKLNPAPIKLKFEKVYLPCVLVAKKRYVGFAYENTDDLQPKFDAKGIETVRRDGVPAQQKMLETSLKILFRSQDLSEVKDYCCRSWAKILEQRASIQDFIFAREVRLGTYSDKVPPPPGVAVAARRMALDPKAEPQYGERVPYVVTRGEPNSRLVDRAVAPEELLTSKQHRLDATYYITRVLIPPLARIFNLVGTDVRSWYDDMPKRVLVEHGDATLLSPERFGLESPVDMISPERVGIEEHLLNFQCLVCGTPSEQVVCFQCLTRPEAAMAGLFTRKRAAEERLLTALAVCTSCTGDQASDINRCESLDCAWFFERKKAESGSEELEDVEELAEAIADLEEGEEEGGDGEIDEEGETEMAVSVAEWEGAEEEADESDQVDGAEESEGHEDPGRHPGRHPGQAL